MYRELLLGAGNTRAKPMGPIGREGWSNLTTVDIDPNCNPDVVVDLNEHRLPFPDDTFDELQAHCVFEHLGRQGDWRGFLAEFSEYYRVLKNGGYIFGTVPSAKSVWLWSDPGHTRAILPETLVFLSQEFYKNAVGKGPATDYRHWYKADYGLVSGHDDGDHFKFVLQAIKPSRIAVSPPPYPDGNGSSGPAT